MVLPSVRVVVRGSMGRLSVLQPFLGEIVQGPFSLQLGPCGALGRDVPQNDRESLPRIGFSRKAMLVIVVRYFPARRSTMCLGRRHERLSPCRILLAASFEPCRTVTRRIVGFQGRMKPRWEPGHGSDAGATLSILQSVAGPFRGLSVAAQRQDHPERRPLLRVRLHLDPTTVSFHDFIGDVEPEPQPLGLS